MTLEFAQSSHDAISASFADKLEAINTAAAFVPSPLQARVMREFVGGRRRLTYLTSCAEGRMNLRNSVASAALDELVDMGYMTFAVAEHKYALRQKGRAHLAWLDLPPVTGIKTPPRTYVNSTMPERLVGVQMPVVRDGGNDNLLIKSMNPCAPQLQRVGA